jgi:hypothetical protein
MFYAARLSSRIMHDVRPQMSQFKKKNSDACQLLVYRCFIFQLNQIGMCFSEIHIGVCLWENRGTKIVS